MIEFILFGRSWKGPRLKGSDSIRMSQALAPILRDTVVKNGAAAEGWISLCTDQRAFELAEITLADFSVDGMPIKAFKDRLFEGRGGEFIEAAAEVWRREGFFRVPGQGQMDYILIGVSLTAKRLGMQLTPEVLNEVQASLATWGGAPASQSQSPEGV